MSVANVGQNAANGNPNSACGDPARVDHFQQFHALGYPRLIPVVPPHAELYHLSSLAARKGVLGKAPGVRGRDGLWRGLDWLKHETTTADFPAWSASGASLGLRTGAGLIALDADTLSPRLAAIVANLAGERLGAARRRIGRAPKFLTLYACAEELPYMCVKFTGDDGREERVELLTEGRQFVAAGVHPDTGAPYVWPEGIPGRDELTRVTGDQVQALFAELARALPGGKVSRGVLSAPDGGPIDPARLAGDPEHVAAAVRAMPNTEALYPTRYDYVRVGQAIKGALPNDDLLAFELYAEWCEKYPPGNEPDLVSRDWERMTATRQLGASWLYEQAEKHSGGAFNIATTAFKVLPDREPNPFEIAAAREAQANALAAGEYSRMPKITSVSAGVEPSAIPTREWVIYPWLPANTAALLVGAPKVGKSTFALRAALLVATGNECILRGKDKISPERLHKRGPVLVYDAEDTRNEMLRRLAGLERFHGVKTDGVHLWSGCDDKLVVATKCEGGKSAKVVRAPECSLLIEAVRELRPALVIVGPLGSLSVGTNENDNDEMGEVISIIRKIAEDEGTTILVVQHTGKGEIKSDLDAGRGASAIIGGVRGGVVMEEIKSGDVRLAGLPEGRYVRLDVSASNYGAKVAGVLFQLKAQSVGNGSHDPAPASAEAAFDDEDAAAALKKNGDTVAVHELVDTRDAAKRVASAKASDDNRQRELVVALALDALGGAPQKSFSEVWLHLGLRFQEAELLRSSTRKQSVSDLLTRTLGSTGRKVESGGRVLRLWFEKAGTAANAPLMLRQELCLNDAAFQAVEDGGVFD